MDPSEQGPLTPFPKENGEPKRATDNEPIESGGQDLTQGKQNQKKIGSKSYFRKN